MENQNPSFLIKFHCSNDAQEFLKKNLNSDVNKLYLKHGKNENLKYIIDQIFIRQKIRKKIPLWYANPRLVFTKNVSHEQASSEATALLKSKMVSGTKMIDITGGMGVDLYYFSKSFKSCLYAERQVDLAHFTKHNFKELGAENIEVFIGDSLEKIITPISDYIYVDPARRGDSNSKLIRLSDCEPNVLKIKDNLIANGRIALIKASPMLDIQIGIKDLENVFEVWIISHRNETKEVVFCLKNGNHNPLIRTFNIQEENLVENFDFHFDHQQKVKIAKEESEFLYEPNSSLQKAKGGDALALKFGLEKLDPNTNLYFSNKRLDHYPGKIFKVERILKPYDKSLKKTRFNIISRNFPDKADVIQRKLNIKSAKNQYLIACKASYTNYIFIHASHINQF